MAKSKKMKYVPSFMVKDEDAPLVLKDEEGNEHRPHEGEWVRFRQGVPMKVMRLSTMAANSTPFILSKPGTPPIGTVLSLTRIASQPPISWISNTILITSSTASA